MFEDQLRILTPHTFTALEKLVMAMAAVSKNAGKTSFFGRDKGQEAYSKFLFALKVTMQAMMLDGVTQESASTAEVLAALGVKLEKFVQAFPNWQDAYAFGNEFFNVARPSALATMDRLRSIP